MPSPDLRQPAQNTFDAVAGQLDAQASAHLDGAGWMEKFRYRYGHADSALFATTVAAITGWPVVRVTAPAGAVHHLVATPGAGAGQLVDVTGMVSAAALQQRHGTTDLALVPVSPPATAAAGRLEVLQLLAELNYAPFNSVAFQRQLLAFCADQGVHDQDMPSRVTHLQLERAASDNDVLTASRFLAQALTLQGPAGPELPDAGWLESCGATAAHKNNADFVQVLLDATDIPLALDKDGFSWLHAAVAAGALDTVKLLLLHSRSAHLVGMVRADDHWTPLHDAAYRLRVEVASALIAAGADVNARLARSRETPLHRCIGLAHLEEPPPAGADMTTLLLAHGADPRLFDHLGRSALHYAVQSERTSLVHLMAAHGVPVDHAEPGNGAPAIFLAVQQSNPAMVEVLRALGANTAAYSSGGHTLLTHCIWFLAEKKFDLAQNLRLPGAEPLTTPSLMVQYLLEVVGLDPDQPNLHGETPDALAVDLPAVRQVLDAFRARRAMASVLAAAGQHVRPVRRHKGRSC